VRTRATRVSAGQAGYALVPRSRRYYNITHHTVGVDSDATKNVWENLDEIRFMTKRLQLIRPDLGADVPYNAVVFPAILDGQYVLVVCEGRGYDRSGAHTAGALPTSALPYPYNYFNVGGFASSWAGNFENEAFDYAPFASANKAYLRHLKVEMPNLGTRTIVPGRVTNGHRDFKDYSPPLNQTACCGQILYSKLGEFTFDGPTDEEEQDVLLQAKMNVGALFIKLGSDVEQGFRLNPIWCNEMLAIIGAGATAPVTARKHAKGLLEYGAGEAFSGGAINTQAMKELRHLVTVRPTLV